jgi:uncharacterized protein
MTSREARAWLLAIALGAAVTAALDVAGVQSAPILGGCLGAAAVVLWLGRRGPLELRVPRLFRSAAQGVIGVNLGLDIQLSTLIGIGSGWTVVVAVLLGTIGVCVLAASLVTRCTGISLATARIGLMPGGASVSVAMSDEIGTDARLVAVMQYLRVYLILVTLPFVSSWIHTGPAHPGSSPPAEDPLSPWLGAAILVASLLVTFPLMKVVRLPSGFLLFPLLITAVVTSVYTARSAVIPNWLLSVALQVIGLLVGLQFTVESLRQARDALAVIVAAMLAIIAVCAGFGFLLSAVLDRSFLDGYLATTPGGVNVILGVVTSDNADATFVTAAQVLRIIAMLLVVPLLGSWRSRDVRRDKAAL